VIFGNWNGTAGGMAERDQAGLGASAGLPDPGT
jgi:hypothetical protein